MRRSWSAPVMGCHVTDPETGECSLQKVTSNSLTMLGWSSFFITAISRTMSLGRLGVLEACRHSSRVRRSQQAAAQGRPLRRCGG